MLSPISSMLIPTFFLFVATLVSCTPTSAVNPVITAVYQFPSGAYLENLAVGHESILVTRADTPLLYQIILPARPHASAYASLIYHFPNATGLMGITEYAPNTFAVIVGNFSMTKLVPGTWSVWSVQIFDKNHPTAEKIVDLVEAQFLNGMTILNKTGAILIADSLAGCVYRLDVRTGDYEVVLEHESMKATGAIGLNGIRTVTTTTESLLYYDNSKTTAGKYITLAHGFYADDLAYDYETGDVWVAGNADNTIFRINFDGEEIVVANASSTPSVVTPSSLAFGKGRHSRTLFGTTYAGVAPNGTVTGGNLLAIDVGIENAEIAGITRQVEPYIS
ncbi:hypothetical protein N7519_003337 [Penicillium mononematosum]|uniref:uncharacterized protein n=1 Tax=Penicillium mononematosum TaxID=268346 RepID=UPI002549AFA5|nr:uncharacterized protein N7519_003337 [Penicillium mononematosum]KAJ6188429.1 hypothetical protein N7519_003337 [Penicillium mononematosum]